MNNDNEISFLVLTISICWGESAKHQRTVRKVNVDTYPWSKT